MQILIVLILSQTVKVAFLHHGNQGFSDHGNYALLPGQPGFIGNSYHLPLDSHISHNVPAEFHISGPLLQSFSWLQNDNGLLNKLTNPVIDIVGGTYAENILPYAESEMNLRGMRFADTLYSSLLKPPGRENEPTVVWIPERVWKDESNMPYSLIAVLNQVYGKYGYTSGGYYVWIPPVILLDDNVHNWYPHTFPDGTNCNSPFKVHRMYDNEGNMVFVVFISKTARDNWVWNDVSSPDNPLNGLLWSLHNSTDQEQVVIYADDWEKAAGVAGWDFGHPGVPAQSYENNIAWVTSQNWIQPVFISEVAKWWGLDKMYDDADPLNDPPIIDIPYGTYEELHSWTGGSYDNWYNDFKNTVAWGCGSGPDLNQNGVYGDYEDLWKFSFASLSQVLDGPFKTYGFTTMMGMLYETAWHSWNDNSNSFVLAGWGKNQWNHSRYGSIFAWSQTWLDSLRFLNSVLVDSIDLDADGINELVAFNQYFAFVIDKRGGRTITFVTSDGKIASGNTIGFFGGEGDYDDGGHPGLFDDTQAHNSWFNFDVEMHYPDSVIIILTEAYNAWGDPESDLSKRLVIYQDRPYLELRYTSDWQNWTKSGITPDLLHNYINGYSLIQTTGLTTTGWTYAGFVDTSSNYYTVYVYPSGQGLTYHYLNRLSSGAELIELGGTSGEYRFFFYAGIGPPDIEEQGPGDLEGPSFSNTQIPVNVMHSDSALILTEVMDASPISWVKIRYGTNGNWIYPDILMYQDDGQQHDWNSNGLPDPQLYGGYIPPQPWGTIVEFALHAQDSFGNESWDNNYGNNYSYTVGYFVFNMDGILDENAELLSQNGGMHLWAFYAPLQNILYVATESAGDGIPGFQNDHFIFVSTDPDSMVHAPWAKSGLVGQYDLFLSDENDNSWAGWYTADGSYLTDTTIVQWASSPWHGGVLEGTVNLNEFFGFVPETLYLAVGSYETWDDGTLQWQVPPPIIQNGNIEPEEFYLYPTPVKVSDEQNLPKMLRVIGPYPNPVTKVLNLSVEPLDYRGKVKILIYSVDGRQVFKNTYTPDGGRVSIPIKLTSGVYFLRIKTGTHNSLKKFVVINYR